MSIRSEPADPSDMRGDHRPPTDRNLGPKMGESACVRIQANERTVQFNFDLDFSGLVELHSHLRNVIPAEAGTQAKKST